MEVHERHGAGEARDRVRHSELDVGCSPSCVLHDDGMVEVWECERRSALTVHGCHASTVRRRDDERGRRRCVDDVGRARAEHQVREPVAEVAGDGDEPGRVGGEVVLHACRGADGVVDDGGVQTRRVERPLFAETADVLVGVLVGSVVASPGGADAHWGRARLGDGHDGELHAEGVGPGRGDRQADARRSGSRRRRRRGGRRRAVGIAASSSGSGWTTKGPATTTGWRPRSMMSRAGRADQGAGDCVPARGSTSRPGRSRGLRRGGGRRRRRRCRPRRGCGGRRGRCRGRGPPRCGCGPARNREAATVTVWTVAPKRAASARAVGIAPSAKGEPSSGTRIVRKTGSGARRTERSSAAGPRGRRRGVRGVRVAAAACVMSAHRVAEL